MTTNPTPAERLAARKPWRRPKRNGPPQLPRKAVWNTRLRAVREELKLSMRDVAKAAGVSLSAYWQIENGTDPMLTNAMRIASFFGMTVESLWPKRRGRAR